jgi:paraquat-inducible protein B
MLRGANPYDIVAQRIEALVNGLVPKVARGVFGEVGVLTDQDIAHYKKILPSMRSQPELATILLADLRRKLDQTRIANLDVFNKAGYDVSKFDQTSAPIVDIQRQISEAYDQLMKTPKNTPEYEKLYGNLRDLMRERRKMQRIATP